MRNLNGESAFRIATLKDTLVISGMLRRFYRRDGAIYNLPYDHESCVLSVENTIRRGVVVVGTQSCAGALIAPFEFNFRFLIAQVFFWYFESPRECVVFDALCRECAKRGASLVNAASVGPKHGAKKFYARRGLVLAEAHHLGINPQFACALTNKGAQDSEMNELATSPIGGPS